MSVSVCVCVRVQSGAAAAAVFAGVVPLAAAIVDRRRRRALEEERTNGRLRMCRGGPFLVYQLLSLSAHAHIRKRRCVTQGGIWRTCSIAKSDRERERERLYRLSVLKQHEERLWQYRFWPLSQNGERESFENPIFLMRHHVRGEGENPFFPLHKRRDFDGGGWNDFSPRGSPIAKFRVERTRAAVYYSTIYYSGLRSCR